MMPPEIRKKVDELYLHYILQALERYYPTQTLPEFNTLNSVADHIKADKAVIDRWTVLVNPDEFMSYIYEKLVINGCLTLPDMREFYQVINPKSNYSDRHIDREFKKRCTFLKSFKLVSHEMVTGVKGQMNFYVAPFCTEEQYNDYTRNFKKCREYHEFYNTIIYYHKSQAKEKKFKDINIEELTKEALEKEAKDTITKKVKQATRHRFNCCNNRFTTEHQLKEHWKSKQTIVPSPHGKKYACVECGRYWYDEQVCSHNCEFTYKQERQQYKKEVATLLDEQKTASLLLEAGND